MFGCEALRGSPDEIAASIRALAAAGIDHIQVGVVPYSPSGVERFGQVLERL